MEFLLDAWGFSILEMEGKAGSDKNCVLASVLMLLELALLQLLLLLRCILLALLPALTLCFFNVIIPSSNDENRLEEPIFTFKNDGRVMYSDPALDCLGSSSTGGGF